MNDKQLIDFSTIEPYCVIQSVFRNIWMVVLAGVIGILASIMVLTLLYIPSYSSGITFVVTARSSVNSYYSDAAVAEQTAATFSELLQSPYMRGIVAKEMGRSKINGSITATQIENTNLIRVDVKANNPKEAFMICKTIENGYADISDYISSMAILQVVDPPAASTVPSNRESIKFSVLFAGVLCAFLTLAGILIITLMRDTIQNREGVKKRLSGRLLAVIPHEVDRSKKIKRRAHPDDMLITVPTRSYGFCESMKMICTRLEHEGEKGRKVFLTTSISESEGKSTVSANIAINLGAKGYKVLLIDLDMRLPAQKEMLARSAQDLTELGTLLEDEKVSPQGIVNKANLLSQYNIHVLFNEHSHLESLEKLSSPRMEAIINCAKEVYDYVIIDTSPLGYFADSQIISDFTDCSMLVIRQDLVPADDINDGIEVLKAGKAKFLGCILNDVSYLVASNSEYGYGHYGYGRYGYGYGKGYGKSHGYGYGYGYGYGHGSNSKSGEASKSSGK